MSCVPNCLISSKGTQGNSLVPLDRLGEKARVRAIRDGAIFVKKKTRKGEKEIIYELNEKPKVFRVLEAPRPKSPLFKDNNRPLYVFR